MTTTTQIEAARQRELLAKIAELGGKGMKDDDIVFEGEKLVLPERWRDDLDAPIKYLQKKKEEYEEISIFNRTYNYRPWDGAYNAFKAMKKAFGMVTGKTTYSFFGANRPHYIQVPISVTETEEVPWGQFQIPLLAKTTITFNASQSREYGEVFTLTFQTPRVNQRIAEGLFKLVEEELKENSIYRGKCVDGQMNFLDLRGFNDSKIVYAEQVQADLHAHLWNFIRYPEQNRILEQPSKYTVLLNGPYGTGKSLAGLKTAKEAEMAGRTFIMVRPGRDDFAKSMQDALIYQPSIVFMEDVDTIAKADNQSTINELMDLFDGITTKNVDMIMVLTTNHAKLLHKGMLRSGRTRLIEIGALDATGIQKLITLAIGDRLDKKIDWPQVVQACDQYLPSFLTEVADSAIRYSLSRNEGKTDGITISTDDLVFAANGLRYQFNMMQEAKEFSTGDSLAESLDKIMTNASTKSVAQLAAKQKDGYEVDDMTWDINRLAEVQNNSVPH